MSFIFVHYFCQQLFYGVNNYSIMKTCSKACNFKSYLPVPEVKIQGGGGAVLFKIGISTSTFSPGRPGKNVLFQLSRVRGRATWKEIFDFMSRNCQSLLPCTVEIGLSLRCAGSPLDILGM